MYEEFSIVDEMPELMDTITTPIMEKSTALAQPFIIGNTPFEAIVNSLDQSRELLVITKNNATYGYYCDGYFASIDDVVLIVHNDKVYWKNVLIFVIEDVNLMVPGVNQVMAFLSVLPKQSFRCTSGLGQLFREVNDMILTCKYQQAMMIRALKLQNVRENAECGNRNPETVDDYDSEVNRAVETIASCGTPEMRGSLENSPINFKITNDRDVGSRNAFPEAKTKIEEMLQTASMISTPTANLDFSMELMVEPYSPVSKNPNDSALKKYAYVLSSVGTVR